MPKPKRVNKKFALDELRKLLQELNMIRAESEKLRDYKLGEQKLMHWRNRAIATISDKVNENEGINLRNFTAPYNHSRTELGNFCDSIDAYIIFLQAIEYEVDNHPEHILRLATLTEVADSAATLAKAVAVASKIAANKLEKTNKPVAQPVKKVSAKNVAVVYGRNAKLQESIFNFLRALGLNPLEWNTLLKNTRKPAPYIGDVLEAMFNEAQAVVVVLSGDDEARLVKEFCKEDKENELSPQSRPNVLFEAGMSWGKDPKRTILVQIGEHRVITDIQGLHITYLDNSANKRAEFKSKLETVGCDVDNSGTDWLTTGDFDLKYLPLPKDMNVHLPEPLDY